MKIFIIICFFLTAIRSLIAQGPDPNAPVGTTPRILADVAEARREADKKLDQTFHNALRAIEHSDHISQGRVDMVRKELEASQRAWQEFRRKQCAFLYSYYYEEIGSLGARMAGIWEYESHLIDERIKELENPPNYF